MTSAGYDLDYRLTSLAVNNGATAVSSLAYAYSDGMNLTGISDGVTPANSNTLWYTAANRLQNANGPWGNTTNYYDLVGNRTYNINTVGAVTTERMQSYGTTANRLTGITENTAALRSYTYDTAGNTLTETRPGESFSYTYNKRNRLASVTRNSVAYATYGYNALEQLTSRNTAAVGAPAGTVHYLYDNDNHLIAEANAATGALTRDYIWLASNDNTPIDLPLAIAETATLTTVHADHLGRPTRMTDATKATVWQAIWKPWGEIHQLSGTLTQNLRYPGQYFQIETGYHYNHHRHYDPITGRYTQPDPLRFVDGPSIYAYVKNSPYMYTDRDGSYARLSPPVPPSMVLPKPPTVRPLPPSLMPPTNPRIYEPPPRDQRYPSDPDADRRDYRRVCDQPPPPGLNKCELAQWLYGRAKECLRLRKVWKDEYGPRKHDGAIPEREKALAKALEDLIRECPDQFACSPSGSGSPSGLNYSPAPMTSSWP